MSGNFRVVPESKRLLDVGSVYGRLTVIGVPFYMKQIAWCVVQCACGSSPKIVKANSMRSGSTVSCGCYRKEAVKEHFASQPKHIYVCENCGDKFRNYPSNKPRYCSKKCSDHRACERAICHGESDTRLHGIWCSMKGRCHCKTSHGYKWYGAKGVSVCAEWRNDYTAFRDWAKANGYADSLSLDRINPSGNYEPDNCRWATRMQQMANTGKRCDGVSSKFKGVSWNRLSSNWKVQITVSGKNTYVGVYKSELAAALAYDYRAYELRGEFAWLNFPERKRQLGVLLGRQG